MKLSVRYSKVNIARKLEHQRKYTEILYWLKERAEMFFWTYCDNFKCNVGGIFEVNVLNLW